MPRIIKDEFTKLKITPGERYQIRRKSQGLCVKCGKNPLGTKTLCRPCADALNFKLKYERDPRPIILVYPFNPGLYSTF